MFAMPELSVKFVKISCLKNFRLYGNQTRPGVDEDQWYNKAVTHVIEKEL